MKNNFAFINLILVLTIFANFDKCIAQNIFPASGNVGIGTSSPTAKLQVMNGSILVDKSTSQGYYDIRFRNESASFGYDSDGSYIGLYGGYAATSDISKPFYIAPARVVKFSFTPKGQLGIGVISPKDILHVVADNPTLRLSSQSYYGASGNAKNSIISSIKFVNSDSNENYRSEIRGILTGGWATDVGLSFTTFANGIQKERLRISHNGNIGINTDSPDEALTVKGKIHAQEVKVDLNGSIAPDYVFLEDYDLLGLKEVKDYIKKEGHLPNIPSASEMSSDGINLKEMNLKLLEKVEELTLYLLGQQEEIEDLKRRLKKSEKN